LSRHSWQAPKEIGIRQILKDFLELFRASAPDNQLRIGCRIATDYFYLEYHCAQPQSGDTLAQLMVGGASCASHRDGSLCHSARLF
jgi:hypothetical protein